MDAEEKLKENFLSCSICTEVFRDPRTLSCRHTFCEGCLTEYTKTRQEAIQAKSIPCPICRQLSKVPNPRKPVVEWAKQFKPSFLLQGLLDTFASQHNVTEVSSENCCFSCQQLKEQTKASLLCLECDVLFCIRCAKLHVAMPGMSDHMLSELNVKGNVPRKRKVFCQEHKSVVEYCCQDCNKAVCQKCCIVYHRKCHSVVTIDSMAAHMKEILQKKKKKISVHLNVSKAVLSKQQSRIEEMSQSKDSVLSQIKQVSKEAISLIKGTEKELVDELEDVIEKEDGMLRLETKSGEMDCQLQQQYLEFIDHALGSESQMDLFDVYQMCQSGAVDADMKSDLLVISKSSEIAFLKEFDQCRIRKDFKLGKLAVSRRRFHSVTVYTPTLCNTISINTSDDITTQRDPDDCVLLVVDDTEVLIVTDYINESVKAFYTDGDNVCLSVLQLTHRPHNVSVLNQSHVVLSYYAEDKFTVVNVTPELHHVRDFLTSSEYTCMVVLRSGRLAVGCNNPPSIDILDLSGIILTSVSDERLIQTPRSMCTTKEGNILVTDAGSKSVYGLTPEGQVLFQYKPDGERALHWPRGIAVTETGNILLADNHTSKITQLTETGEFIRDILTSEDITPPHGICVHGNKLYVAQVETNVKVFDLLTL